MISRIISSGNASTCFMVVSMMTRDRMPSLILVSVPLAASPATSASNMSISIPTSWSSDAVSWVVALSLPEAIATGCIDSR